MTFEEYAEMFRHYFPGLNTPTIRDCYKHKATPLEFQRYMESITVKQNKNTKTGKGTHPQE